MPVCGRAPRRAKRALTRPKSSTRNVTPRPTAAGCAPCRANSGAFHADRLDQRVPLRQRQHRRRRVHRGRRRRRHQPDRLDARSLQRQRRSVVPDDQSQRDDPGHHRDRLRNCFGCGGRSAERQCRRHRARRHRPRRQQRERDRVHQLRRVVHGNERPRQRDDQRQCRGLRARRRERHVHRAHRQRRRTGRFHLDARHGRHAGRRQSRPDAHRRRR